MKKTADKLEKLFKLFRDFVDSNQHQLDVIVKQAKYPNILIKLHHSAKELLKKAKFIEPLLDDERDSGDPLMLKDLMDKSSNNLRRIMQLSNNSDDEE